MALTAALPPVPAVPARPGASSPERDDTMAPALFVGLHVRGSAVQKGFSGTLPAEVSPLEVESAGAVPAFLTRALPAGSVWDFARGKGELYLKGNPFPFRLFRLVLPPAQKPFLTMIVKGAARPAMQDESPGSLSATLNGPLAVAALGLKSTNLAALFPVPLGEAPPALSEHLTLQVLASASGTVGSTSAWKIDGAGPALLAGLIKDGVAVAPAQDPTVKALATGIAPYTGQEGTSAQPYVVNSLNKSTYQEGLKAALATYVTSMPAAIVKPSLALSQLSSSATLDLSALAGKDPESNAIAIATSPLVGEHAISSKDGYALPLVSPKNHPYVQVYVSPRAAVNFFAVKAALVHHLVRAWRWTTILGADAYDRTRPGYGLAQTLLRMTEPLFEVIALTTVEKAVGTSLDPLGPQTVLDPVDLAELDRAIGTFAARASNAHAAQLVYSEEDPLSPNPARHIWGTNNDALYPRAGLLPDHLAEQAIYTAMKSADTVKLSRALVNLMSAGFTRPASGPVVTAEPDELVPPAFKTPLNGVDATEPDLDWLARAVAPAAGDHPLAHPFASLASTRAGRVLAQLKRTVSAIRFTGPPATNDLYFCLLASRDDERDLKAALSYALGPLARGRTDWDPGVRTAGSAASGVTPAYNAGWWATYKATPAFTALPMSCTAPTTVTSSCQDWATLTRAFHAGETAIQDVTDNVSSSVAGASSAQSYPMLLAVKAGTRVVIADADGTVSVTSTATSAIASLAGDANPTIRESAALSAACVRAFDANESLIATFTGESSRRSSIAPLASSRYRGPPFKLTSDQYLTAKVFRHVFVSSDQVEQAVWRWALMGSDLSGRDLTAAGPPDDHIVNSLLCMLRVIAAARGQTLVLHTPTP